MKIDGEILEGPKRFAYGLHGFGKWVLYVTSPYNVIGNDENVLG